MGVLMVTLLLLFVVQPAVQRGGFGELLIIIGIFLSILLLERFVRTR